MINRENWFVQKEYLKYLEEVKNLSANSIRMYESLLKHLLNWAGETSFADAPKIRPSFPTYMAGIVVERENKFLAPSYVKKAVRTSKRFFHWLSRKTKYRSISEAFLDTLVPPRMTVEPKERDVVTLEYVVELAKSPVQKIRERRIRAAALFWFLSGIRIGAFCTLPIKAVDLENQVVHQWPKWGVKTKNGSHATTRLLNIPELYEPLFEWDNEIKSGGLLEDDLWFAPLNPETFDFVSDHLVGRHRHDRARKDFREWVNKIGLPYYSPHKFRHGHATYAISHAVTVADLKAISQNLMHSNLSITDGIYSILSDNEIRERIAKLGESRTEPNEMIISQLESILEVLKRS